MRVVLDGRVATDHFPGIGRVAQNLSEALLRVEPGLDLVVLENVHTPPAERLRIGPPRSPCGASAFGLAQQWVVPRQLRALRAEIYHSLFYLMPYWPGVPTVWTCHDLIPLQMPELFPAYKRWIYGVAHRAAARTASSIMATSRHTAHDLSNHLRIPAASIHVVSWGVDSHFVPPQPEAVEALKARLALPDSYFLFLASNRPHKNLTGVVEAYRRVRARLGNEAPGLVVAGPWDARYPEARAQAEAIGAGTAIRFVGTVSEADLPVLYGGALGFFFPSLFEGFGLPVLEAMACGTPVVTSNTTSLPEAAGGAAVLVAPDDIDAIAGAAEKLVRDPGFRAELRARGLARAAAASWDLTARETLGMYRALARRNEARA